MIETGTGFAHPNTGAPVSARISGSTIEPNGSMCLSGLSVSRPARLAVSSPHQRATTPWLTSWSITAGMNTRKKINVCSLRTWCRTASAITPTTTAAMTM